MGGDIWIRTVPDALVILILGKQRIEASTDNCACNNIYCTPHLAKKKKKMNAIGVRNRSFPIRSYVHAFWGRVSVRSFRDRNGRAG